MQFLPTKNIEKNNHLMGNLSVGVLSDRSLIFEFIVYLRRKTFFIVLSLDLAARMWARLNVD